MMNRSDRFWCEREQTLGNTVGNGDGYGKTDAGQRIRQTEKTSQTRREA